MAIAVTDPLDRIIGLDPAAIADPYPLLRELRERDPVHLRPMANGTRHWHLTRYADITAALRDPRFSADRAHGDRTAAVVALAPEDLRESVRAILGLINLWMLRRDPPDHTRLRALVSKAFTPRVIAAMRGRIETVVNELLDAVQDAGRMDVIADLAYPLPTIVIAELLGVPPEDRGLVKQWSQAITRYFDDPLAAAQTWRSMEEMMEYLRDIIAAHRAQPGDDLLSALVVAEMEGDRLTEAELFANCVLLLWAGHETTTNLIGNGLLALLRHPDQCDLLRHDPALMPGAIEELLRYDGPVFAVFRLALADMQIGGKVIRAGESLTLWNGAANHDPAQFPAPDRLDITRAENRHLAFGHGIHFCLGAALARMEGQIALAAVLRRFPALHLATEPVAWQLSWTFHTLKTFPVALA
ncbi:MAG: cytochrome P450 [Chloroflexota bacterium]|nr:cytochrome P450 [Chloroflexota bacterium]